MGFRSHLSRLQGRRLVWDRRKTGLSPEPGDHSSLSQSNFCLRLEPPLPCLRLLQRRPIARRKYCLHGIAGKGSSEKYPYYSGWSLQSLLAGFLAVSSCSRKWEWLPVQGLVLLRSRAIKREKTLGCVSGSS